MSRFVLRVLVASLIFALGCVVHALLNTEPKVLDVRAELSSPPAVAVARSPPCIQVSSPSPPPARHVSQEATVAIPSIGRVKIEAFEGCGDGGEFRFSEAKSGKELLSEYLSDRDQYSCDARRTRFKAITIRGFPTPLIVGVGLIPGGSDGSWECAIAGVVHAHLEELTYEHLTTADEGGFYVGNLGHGMGLGAAQWDFVWGEDEAHVSRHQYEVKLFKWDGRRFRWYKVLRTHRYYSSGKAALREFGFYFVDIRKSFPEWSDIEGW